MWQVSSNDTNLVHIGRVIKPHGVRGEVVIDPTTDDPNGRFAVGQVLLGKQSGKSRELEIKSMRPHQGRLLVSFREIPGRNEAESLRGMKFFAEPVFDDDEEAFYDHELVGLRVLNCGAVDEATANARAYEGEQPEPEDIGVVTGVIRNPSQRLLQIELDDADGVEKREAFVPFVHALVPIVDLENEAIVITPPEGLLDL